MVAGAGLLAMLALGSAYLIGRARAAGVPTVQPLVYSGVLTDANGVPVTDKMRNIQITISDMATAGNQVCSVGPTATALTAGAFQIPLPAQCVTAIHAAGDLWLEVFVDGASVGGRNKLGAVPYSLEADHAVSATSAQGATGALQTTLTQIQTNITALQGAPTLTTIHGDSFTTADDGATGGFASQCIANGLSGASTVTHACTVAANRKCTSLGYSAGIFVGESNGTFASIICIK